MPADVIDYEIFGDDLQFVEIELDPGESILAEAGAMSFLCPARLCTMIFHIT